MVSKTIIILIVVAAVAALVVGSLCWSNRGAEFVSAPLSASDCAATRVPIGSSAFAAPPESLQAPLPIGENEDEDENSPSIFPAQDAYTPYQRVDFSDDDPAADY